MEINYNSYLQRNKSKRSFSFIASFLLVSFAAFAQQSFTFTNASATGSMGPTQMNVNAAYLSTNLNGSVTVNPQGVQNFTIPTTGPYRIDARGGQGYGTFGGRGAVIAGDFTLTAGTVLKILVGQQAGAPIGSLNQFGGGGGSFVTFTNNVPLVVAGGGGGSWAGTFQANSDGTVSTSGNAGLNGAAANGAGGTNGGGGATASSADGGAGITGDGGGGAGGLSFVNGGAGGANRGHGGFGGGGGTSSWDNYRSGGGGGYSGGGASAAAGQTGNPQGGGGGSFNGGTNQSNTSGLNLGQGRVIITELCPLSISASGTNSLEPVICSGNSVTLTTSGISNYNWSTGNTTSSVIVVSPTVTTSYSVTATTTLNCSTSAFITVTVNAGVPVLSIANPSSNICLGRTVSLTASGALTYTWSGGISNGQLFTPNSTTSYTVTGGNGCGTSTAVTTITVAPLPVSTVATPTLVCEGYPATLTALAAVDGYTWQPGALTGSTTIGAPLANTIYTVTASDGTCSGTSTVEVTTKTTPTITTGATSITICQGESITLSATGAGVGGTYTWTPGGLSGAAITVTPASSVLYVVNATSSLNCEASANQVVVVAQAPQMQISSSANLVCAGATVNLTASAAINYTWVSGPTTATYAVSPSATTVYTVLGSGNTNSCVATRTIAVGVVVPNVVVSNNIDICEGQTATLTASGANTYAWNGGFASPNNTAQYSPNATTLYTLVANTQSLSVNCSTTHTILVTVNPNPTVTVVASRQTICRGETNTLTLSGASNYIVGTSPVTGNAATINPQISTIYTVSGTDENGCENSIIYQSIVSPCTGISESELFMQTISVFPNPNNGEFTVNVASDITLSLMNNLGQVLKTIALNSSNNFTAELSNVSAGVYFLVGQNENGKVNQKIIIAK
jgi:hypothetical protein